jgi:hypothetical protein
MSLPTSMSDDGLPEVFGARGDDEQAIQEAMAARPVSCVS